MGTAAGGGPGLELASCSAAVAPKTLLDKPWGISTAGAPKRPPLGSNVTAALAPNAGEGELGRADPSVPPGVDKVGTCSSLDWITAAPGAPPNKGAPSPDTPLNNPDKPPPSLRLAHPPNKLSTMFGAPSGGSPSEARVSTSVDKVALPPNKLPSGALQAASASAAAFPKKSEMPTPAPRGALPPKRPDTAPLALPAPVPVPNKLPVAPLLPAAPAEPAPELPNKAEGLPRAPTLAPAPDLPVVAALEVAAAAPLPERPSCSPPVPKVTLPSNRPPLVLPREALSTALPKRPDSPPPVPRLAPHRLPVMLLLETPLPAATPKIPDTSALVPKALPPKKVLVAPDKLPPDQVVIAPLVSLVAAPVPPPMEGAFSKRPVVTAVLVLVVSACPPVALPVFELPEVTEGVALLKSPPVAAAAKGLGPEVVFPMLKSPPVAGFAKALDVPPKRPPMAAPAKGLAPELGAAPKPAGEASEEAAPKRPRVAPPTTLPVPEKRPPLALAPAAAEKSPPLLRALPVRTPPEKRPPLLAALALLLAAAAAKN